MIGEGTWDQLVGSLHSDNSERFLEYVDRAYLERILFIQLQKQDGDVNIAVENVLGILKRTEAASEALHEHSAKMDNAYFEKLVKADTFLVRGKDKKHSRPIWWVRDGKMTQGIWRLAKNSPKEHSFIRHEIFFYQQAMARMLAEQTYGTMGPSPVIVFDLSEAGMLDFNISIVSRVASLSQDLFGCVDPHFVISGFSKFSLVGVNLVLSIFPKTFTKWTFLEDAERIFDIVEEPKDVPHWWFGKNDDRKRLAARRDTSDPREYWCWRRCTTEGNRIGMKDVLNPDPTCWLNECNSDSKDACLPVASDSSVLGSIEVREDIDEW